MKSAFVRSLRRLAPVPSVASFPGGVQELLCVFPLGVFVLRQVSRDLFQSIPYRPDSVRDNLWQRGSASGHTTTGDFARECSAVQQTGRGYWTHQILHVRRQLPKYTGFEKNFKTVVVVKHTGCPPVEYKNGGSTLRNTVVVVFICAQNINLQLHVETTHLSAVVDLPTNRNTRNNFFPKKYNERSEIRYTKDYILFDEACCALPTTFSHIEHRDQL